MSEVTPQVLVNINGDVRDASSLTVPQDRTFRNAWKFTGKAVEVDMTAAVEIQKNNLRVERAKEFSRLDAEWFRASESGDTAAQKAIAELKTKLRDVTKHPALAAAKTPEELSGLTLAKLVF